MQSLQFLETRSSCPCGASPYEADAELRRRAPWGEVRFVRCRECGSWFQDPQADATSLTAWYDSDEYQGSASHRGSAYVDYLADESQRLAEARSRWRRDIHPWLPGGPLNVLEIGCATGSLLKVAADGGHAVRGVDLSPRFADAARRLYGLEVLVGDFRSLGLSMGHFDVVLLFGTLSALMNLGGGLSAIRRLLRPGGLLIANFPAADSRIARLYGRHYWMFSPSVATFLSRRGCCKAFERAGFRVLTEHIDRQRPSLRKLLNHAKLDVVLSTLRAFGVDGVLLPVSVPIPGVRLIVARAA